MAAAEWKSMELESVVLMGDSCAACAPRHPFPFGGLGRAVRGAVIMDAVCKGFVMVKPVVKCWVVHLAPLLLVLLVSAGAPEPF